MGKRKDLPTYITSAFTENGVNADTLIHAVRSDMCSSMEYMDTWIAFDSENLYFLAGWEKAQGVKSRRRIVITFTTESFTVLPLASLAKLRVERFLSTARILSEKDDEVEEIASFSIGLTGEMESFVKVFNAYKEHGEVKDEDFSSEKELFCPKCGTRYPESDRKVCPKCLNKMSITGRIITFFKDYRKYVIIILGMMLLSSAFSTVTPYVSTKLLYDDVLADAGGPLYGKVLLIVLAILGVRVGSLFLSILYGYVLSGIVPYVVYDLKIKIFSAMQRLSVGFYTSKQTGSLMNRVNSDANNIYWFFVDGLPYVIVNAVTLIGVLGVMISMSLRLTLTTLVVIPVTVVSFRMLARAFRRMYHRLWTYNSNLQSMVSDTLNGHRIIKAFARENEENARFDRLSSKLRGAEISIDNTAFTAFPLIYLLMFAGQTVMIAIGGVMVVKGQISLGTLLTFNVYIGMLYGPLDFMSWVSNWWSRCVDSAQRVFEIIDAKPDVEETDKPIVMDEFKGDINVNDVVFEYEPAHPVIKNMDLKVASGKMLGIVGKAGAGKSTIVNLMARLYDVKEGEISIDGHNVKEFSMKNLRENIGVVSQEIYLFIGTIADNIRYAKPDASIAEVVAAAKAANAHDFIMKLPDAYETWIGAGGQDLSGGERQRVSIARTIIQNPKILILDEATAAMDTETERNIQESLSKLKDGRTTIAIAHRLSTLRDADMLAVIEDGKVLEFGTHTELIAKKGAYFKLYTIQAEALKFIDIGA